MPTCALSSQPRLTSSLIVLQICSDGLTRLRVRGDGGRETDARRPSASGGDGERRDVHDGAQQLRLGDGGIPHHHHVDVTATSARYVIHSKPLASSVTSLRIWQHLENNLASLRACLRVNERIEQVTYFRKLVSLVVEALIETKWKAIAFINCLEGPFSHHLSPQNPPLRTLG